MIKKWLASGSHWVWLNAGAVSASLVLVFGLLLLIAVRGMGHFWPHPVYQFELVDSMGAQSTLIGEIADSEQVTLKRLQEAGINVATDSDTVTRYLIKTGNRDILGTDFTRLIEPRIVSQTTPLQLTAIERREWGNFYGYLNAVKENGTVVADGGALWSELTKRLRRATGLFDEIKTIEKNAIGSVNYSLEKLRLKQRRLELDNRLTEQALTKLDGEKKRYESQYRHYQQRLKTLYQDINRDTLSATVAGGKTVDIPLAKIIRVYQPNTMSLWQKMGFYVAKVWEFLSTEPREANTEGGIFPAIFGTVMMVIIMSIIVTPFGVIAAVYLREYAKQGFFTRIVRIAVNNLAGVPSIVYGVFGLGFFVYFLGGNIDKLFFPEALPAPTFGSPGILWASITLALLTLPVVIVATEEGLARIPKSIREGSLALGATKAETLWRTVLPMASPAMMTGLILAVARAAGEVAPLMLVGVVKLAPSLPLDANEPFLHLDRKFMHLGFHIYDVGFQSPNVEAARPLVYATALLLVAVIVILNLAAVSVRNHLREKYRALEN
jgi:phosphate transport system permease protein